ncbi:hypothetical protein GQ55_1G373300 [Panicum hallii var. hallii]|uniref:Uncharacterized protein n=1 Tax=Panicum hallii var. hallii TaxID=1504633 RepID=A0A2T7FBK4_9POAL|nr:hypothetical protein GQ55_1G373300 [Panicum hallii var. hallii]
MCTCLGSASAPRPLPRTAPLACAARVASGDLAGRPRDPNGQTPAAGAAKKARGTCLRPWERGDRAPRATRPTPRRPVGALWMAMQVLSGHPLARVSAGQSDGPAKGTRKGELKQLRSLPRDSKFLVGIIWLMSMKGMRSAGPGQQVTGAYATDPWLLGFDFLLARNTR